MLESLLYMSGSSARQLEEQLSYGAGTIHRLFKGVIELKLRHVLVILETLDIPPSQFFREAFFNEEKALEGPVTAARILELLGGSPALSDEDLERRLRKALLRMGFAPPPSRG